MPELSPRIRTGARVIAVTRRATDKMKDAGRGEAPFELVVESPAGSVGVRIEALETTDDGIVALHESGAIGPVDEIIAATGFRPDLAMLRELRLGLDPSVEAPTQLAPLIDPNVHTCGSVPPHGEKQLAHPETGFYIAGMKSYGRAPTFLMLTGYEQVRSIAAALAGDRGAADRVELTLPGKVICNLRSPLSEQGEPAGCVLPRPGVPAESAA